MKQLAKERKWSMKRVTFRDVYLLSDVVKENELYRQYHYPKMPARYDSNFIEFKQLPTLSDFEEAVAYLKEFQKQNGQKHVKFVFPAGEKLTADLFFYLIGQDFNMGIMELYAIDPNDFPDVEADPDIDIQVVTEDNFETYLHLQYQHDLPYGKDFADQKVMYHKRHFADDKVTQMLAFYKGAVAGSVDVILDTGTAEIDGLAVGETFQRKGIGSRLQKQVMELFPDRTVILVADGEDSPREMYKKQNYQYIDYRHEVQRIFES